VKGEAMRALGLSAFIVAIWLAVALTIDRLFVSSWCLQCATGLALEIKLALPGATLTVPPISLAVLLLFPMLLLALFLIPWRDFQNADAWRVAFSKWAAPWMWLAVAVLLCILGESIFLVTRDNLPRALTALAEKFTITGTVSVAIKGFKETTPLAVTASLSGLLGLMLGMYLFLEKGINAIFKFGKAA
jgi:hypothetical protein